MQSEKIISDSTLYIIHIFSKKASPFSKNLQNIRKNIYFHSGIHKHNRNNSEPKCQKYQDNPQKHIKFPCAVLPEKFLKRLEFVIVHKETPSKISTAEWKKSADNNNDSLTHEINPLSFLLVCNVQIHYITSGNICQDSTKAFSKMKFCI